MTPAPDPPDDDLVSDEDLVAYLDGELPPDDERAVEDHLAADAATRARADELKRTYDLLDFLPRPAPSESFATRTLTAVMPLVPGSASRSQFTPARPRRRWAEVAAWVAAVVAAVALGGSAHRLVVPPVGKRDEPPTADDYKLMARLPLYAGVDDLDFLRALEKTDLFDTGVAGDHSDRPAPPMSDDERDALLAQFRTFPPARQQQLRTLHQALADPALPDREPLLRTLEGYAVWLGRLPAAERRRVLDAPPADRLDAVRSAYSRQWRETLPKAKQAAIKDAADSEERAALVAVYRGQEHGRRDEWELAARRWKQFGDKGHTPWPFDDPERVRQIDEYIQSAFGVNPKSLPTLERERKNDLPPGCRLTREELVTLRSHREAATQEGYWLSYGAFLLRLTEQHPTLPKPKSGKPIVEPGQMPLGYNVPGPAKVRPSVGKWPDFALDVWRATPRPEAKTQQLGPCRPDEFTDPVRKFVLETLTDADRKRLEPALGKWPLYPQRLLELARSQNLSVPEVMLPGEPKRWQEMYQLSGKK